MNVPYRATSYDIPTGTVVLKHAEPTRRRLGKHTLAILRQIVRGNRTQQEIAAMYSVSHQYVSQLRRQYVVITLLLAMLFVAPANAQVEYPQTVKTGRISLTVPGDSRLGKDNTNSPLKRTQTSHYFSKSLEATITVTCIQYKDVAVTHSRLTEFLEQFIASYGSVDHLATIKEDGRKGMGITTEIYHDRSQQRFTYVDTRVFADDTNLYAVTVEAEVAPNKPLRTNELTEIIVSMKVTQ